MTVPKVSIVLPTYNRAKFIGKAIESVVMQSFRDWELIISDDASIDETPVIVRAWQEKDSRIHYRKNESNVGIARNINQGIRGAQGELIALIDDDDSWIPKDKLEKQIAFLDSHPDYVGVGGGMVVVDREGKELFRYFKPETDIDIRKSMLFSNPIAHSTTVYRKFVALKAGLYDESLTCAADREFFLRLGKEGKLYNFPAYFAYYTTGSQNALFRNQRELFATNLRFLRRYKKNYPNYLPAFVFNGALYLYSLLPEGFRGFVNMPLFYFKRKVFDRISH